MIKVIAQTRANKRKEQLNYQMKDLIENREELQRLETVIEDKRQNNEDWKTLLVVEAKATLLRKTLGNKLSRFI